MNVQKLFGAREDHGGLQAVEEELTRLPAPASPLSHVDRLHPIVGELLNQVQIEAAKKTAVEHVRSAQEMFDEAARKLAEAKTWAETLIEEVTKAAIETATLHARLRHAHAGQAQVHAIYESGELPISPAACSPALPPTAPAPVVAAPVPDDAPRSPVADGC